MKTVKFFTLLFILFAGITSANAQDETETDDCAKYRSLYYQYLKQGMYRDAMNFWGKAYTACSAQGEVMDGKFWKNGRVGYLQLLKAQKKAETPNEAAEQGINDTIAWIYEERMKVEEDCGWEADYAVFLVSNKDDRFGKIDTLFSEAVHCLKSEASYTHIKVYFTHLIVNKFNNTPAEEQEEIRGMIIEEYVTLSEYTGAALDKANGASDERNIKGYTATQQFLDKYFLQVAKDCEALVPVMEKKFDELPPIEEKEARLEEINKYLGLLDNKSCQTTDIYGKYLDAKLEIDPTAEAYYFKGNLETKKENYSGAVEAYKKAVELEGDGENKDLYTYALASAQLSTRSYKSAFNTAKTVGGEHKGNALLICASSIAALANDCGTSTFERRANYWLANDYVNKAIANGASASSSKYLDNAPDDQMLFDEGVSKGGTVTLSCWGETTTIR